MRISDWSSDVCSSDLEQAGNRLIVILNDNDMSIAPPVGGLSAYLARLISSSEYLGLRSLASRVAKKVSRRVYQSLGKAEEYTRGMEIGRAHVELQSLMRISYAVFCLKKKKNNTQKI